MWQELVRRYTRGVAEVIAMRATWAGLAGHVDAELRGGLLAITADLGEHLRDRGALEIFERDILEAVNLRLAMIDGAACGSVTRRKIIHRLAPRVAAASS